MTHIPFGYIIENGHIKINPVQARQLKVLFESYRDHQGLSRAGKDAGTTLTHSRIAHILADQRYLGDDIYPAIIDQQLFDAVQDKRRTLKEKHHMTGWRKEKHTPNIPTVFHIRPEQEHFENIREHVQYIYTLIESEDESCHK
ncbi:recombinase family protein [Collinsella sp. zg1085]|uniref:recombinase family protein n=1 Tax=Collinsella sp. zg1085 TaxID=2844380 RepID=UPI001C0CD945|nr:recombinase family protein [Collinsella sp. zg1085]QWT17701.1 recombinase family protein [Collinsella sp. zg1085]